MSLRKKIEQRAVARAFRVKNKVNRVSSRDHKAIVNRTNKHIYVAISEVATGRTLFEVSTLAVDSLKNKSVNLDSARLVGEMFGKKCVENNILKISFDRNGFLYHGKIAALADGIRSAGVEF